MPCSRASGIHPELRTLLNSFKYTGMNICTVVLMYSFIISSSPAVSHFLISMVKQKRKLLYIKFFSILSGPYQV